ncbi:hypothetical protein T459_09856 [Capsicum annuum]|uniref:NFXL1 RRM-like domain-containing protein n=1 Tax=Capsicum annuum TaxID=4072 RepID=A0A2G3A0L6_CAPAN|nr:hypothetical protein T459_09856 [Capsicum annuum]
MDPRLVVALFDLPRDADISALVLRFDIECELVWLNDKNALAVFNDPARTATIMRRLDQGSTYYGATVVPQSSVSSAGATTTNVWGVFRAIKDREGVADLRVAPSAWRVNEAPPAASSDRWSILEPEITSSLPRASITIKQLISQPKGSGSVSSSKSQHVGVGDMADVVDNWDKAYD